ncbi:dienelactone hydrolase family protein [Nocardia transvalensis]|uniref:dienelactone hydrolase family protein n=1 Tax=Nocardia transvalensis TaxID=37333 RepID=UPI0018943686|nr:dienelactone hydrolase family protein [Nocardia transvalensis]MBF6328526.1 dienelactone hydrolase family protein [Nocardia transvalensis]
MSGVYRDHALLRATDPAAEDQQQPVVRVRVPITVIEPEGNARGGIVVLHESREFADSLLEFMKSLAGEGWIVVAPNLFHRNGASEETVFGDDLFTDSDACFAWLLERGVHADCIGVLGFDSAGTAALLVATNRRIGAAISVAAPGITEPIAERADALVHAAPRLQAPWLGLYGADDPVTPAEEVEQLREAAAHAAVATLLVTYPGLHHRADHPGFDPTVEDPETVVDAQTRIFDWFDSHLR